MLRLFICGQRRARRWMGAVMGSLLLALTPALAGEPPFLPPQAAVVLLTGVPGDLENETALRDQLHGWFEVLEAAHHTGKVFALCDSPDSVSLPPKLNVQVLKADKAGFLSLTNTLAGETNPLVVIIWGHGGKQGNAPVFHVRGPRLLPADFAAFAAKVPSPTATWLLFFRGSGQFGHQLAADKRQILSSDGETSFGNDPVAMGMLLKLARANPAISFSALSRELGRATVAWYNERHLARTEDPTLWLDTGKPRQLASLAEGEGSTPVSNEAVGGGESPGGMGSGAGSSSTPAAKDAKEDTAAAETKDLPAAWDGIKRVDPTKYPGADGVTLRRRLTYTLGSNPAIATEEEEFIQVLTPEGKRLGDFDISYSPPAEEINFVDCEVLRPDGQLVRLDPDAIREASPETLGDYQVGHRKFFSLPAVGPGAVLHVRYRTQWQRFPLPHVSVEVPVDLELPAREAVIQVSVPKGTPFHFAWDNLTAPDPEIKQGSYGTTYSWRFGDLPPRQREYLSSPHQQPHLLVSTFPDWQAFAGWYARISQLTDEVTPELKAKAAELTRDAKSNREKVLALYNYVTALRYVAVPMGVNSFRPHAASNVLHNQYGDCKDKANLFNTLLRASGLEGRLVLVPRFSQAHDAIPGLAFNHAISRVSLDGQEIWVDTTDDVCRFGLLPPGDPGRKVLVIDGKTSSLTQLPAPDPKQHQLKLTGKLNCAGAVDAMPISLEAVAIGYPDYELREAAREAKELSAWLPLLAAKYRPVAGSIALEKQSATAVSALDQDFSWHADGQHVGLAATGAGKRLLHSPFWLPKEWEAALHQRKTALFLNQGYPLALDEQFEIQLPAGAQAVALPPAGENAQGPLRWHIEWKKNGQDKLEARFHAELVRGELSAEETPLLQTQIRALLSALAAVAEVKE